MTCIYTNCTDEMPSRDVYSKWNGLRHESSTKVKKVTRLILYKHGVFVCVCTHARIFILCNWLCSIYISLVCVCVCVCVCVVINDAY